MVRRGRRKYLKGMALAGVAALAVVVSYAADVVSLGPTAADADASIVPVRYCEVVSCIEARVGSFADSAPGEINGKEPRGFKLILR